MPKDLTDHEKRIQELLLEELSCLPGFPDQDRKLNAITRAYARFASTEPYQLPTLNHLRPHYTPAQIERELEPHRWKEGLIPAEWLVEKIRDSRRFFPMPIEARHIYCEAGFPTLDGRSADSLDQDRKRDDDGEK